MLTGPAVEPSRPGWCRTDQSVEAMVGEGARTGLFLGSCATNAHQGRGVGVHEASPRSACAQGDARTADARRGHARQAFPRPPDACALSGFQISYSPRVSRSMSYQTISVGTASMWSKLAQVARRRLRYSQRRVPLPGRTLATAPHQPIRAVRCGWRTARHGAGSAQDGSRPRCDWRTEDVGDLGPAGDAGLQLLEELGPQIEPDVFVVSRRHIGCERGLTGERAPGLQRARRRSRASSRWIRARRSCRRAGGSGRASATGSIGSSRTAASATTCTNLGSVTRYVRRVLSAPAVARGSQRCQGPGARLT